MAKVWNDNDAMNSQSNVKEISQTLQERHGDMRVLEFDGLRGSI
jgi:hypothetical protein